MGLLSRTLEPLVAECIEHETSNSLKVIKQSKISNGLYDNVLDGVLPLAKQLFNTFHEDMDAIRKVGGGHWPLVVYSKAIQNITQNFIKFLSLNLSR